MRVGRVGVVKQGTASAARAIAGLRKRNSHPNDVRMSRSCSARWGALASSCPRAASLATAAMKPPSLVATRAARA